jgi:hypothetical protein
MQWLEQADWVSGSATVPVAGLGVPPSPWSNENAIGGTPTAAGETPALPETEESRRT